MVASSWVRMFSQFVVVCVCDKIDIVDRVDRVDRVDNVDTVDRS